LQKSSRIRKSRAVFHIGGTGETGITGTIGTTGETGVTGEAGMRIGLCRFAVKYQSP